MSDHDTRTRSGSDRGSGGPEVETPAPDANTDPTELDVNPEIHPSGTDDLSDPDELPQVDEDLAQRRPGD